MQRYKCITKEKNTFVGRTRGRRMVDSAQLSKRIVDLIYVYMFLKIKVLVSSERSV